MGVYYEVDITLGPYSWSIQQGDTPDPVDPGPLGGLEFGWELPTQDTYPCQPEPMDAALAVVVSDAADVAALDIGSAVGIKVRFDASGTWPLEFYGQVTDLIGSPHDRGWMVSLNALDYTVDDEHSVTGANWPAELANARLSRIFTAAGVAEPAGPWTAFVALTHPAREISSETWRSLAVTSLDAMLGTHSGDVVVRAVLAPVVTAGALDGYALDGIRQTNDGTLPGEFGATDDGYGIVFTADPAAGVLDACRVERSVSWSRRKYDAVNRLEIAATDDTVLVASTGGTPVVTGRLSLDVFGVTDTDPSFLDFYLPDSGAVSRWAIDSLVWRMDKEDQATLEALTQGWMPVHAAAAGSAVRTLAYRRPVVVADIPDAQNPAGSPAYTGQLRGARFTIEGGKPRMGFTMRRTLPEPTVDPLTPAGLAASAFSAVTVAQLDPDFTVYDYRLCQEA